MSAKFATVYCDKCKHEFSMDTVDIKRDRVTVDGKNLILVYFVCPKCNRLYRAGLFDDEFFEMRKEVDEVKRKIRRNFASMDKEMGDRLSQMLTVKINRMKRHSDKLRARFNGTFVLVASENNHNEYVVKYLP